VKTVLVTVVLTVMLLAASPAAAGESYRCWTERRVDPDIGLHLQVVVCRIDGRALVVFDRPGDAPVVLHPAVGRAGGGECWYWRSVFTGWVLERLLGSSAVLRYEPPGGGALYDATFARCGSEPEDDAPPLAMVWSVISRLAVPRPEFVLDPPITSTGLDTYVATRLPEALTGSAVSPVTGSRVDVVVAVDEVDVAWGDGAMLSVGGSLLGALGGHPEGAIRHVYESRGVYTVRLTFVWGAQWRVDAGPWHSLRIDPTVASSNLRVDELTARRAG